MTRRPDTDVRLDVEPSARRPPPRSVDDPSFHVALLGDFGGREGETTDRPVAIPVDRDDLDGVLARLDPRARVGTGEVGVEVGFADLEDFHPDRLVERLPLFRAIRDAAEGGSHREPSPRPEAPTPTAPVDDMLSGSVLDRIVDAGEGEGEGDAPRRPRDPLRAWVDDLVRPHLERAPSPDDARAAEKVDRLVAEGMREVLRDPAFRRLEALWRGVDFLVSRVETGSRLKIHLVDVGPGDLAREGGMDGLTECLRAGVEPGGQPWSLVAALWEVGAEPEELVRLRTLARVVRAEGAVLLAGASPSLEGPLWDAFRREPEAESVGLAMPRFLLRMPYGDDADPCERLDLEEIVGTPSARDYLWAPAALGPLLLLARAFARGGRALVRALEPEIGGLPFHVVDGEATPCTEVALTRAEADRLAEHGLMPIGWMKDTDRIRVDRLQSVADPARALAGWWRG